MPVLIFIAGLLLLYAGGEGLVRASVALGSHFGMSPLIAGLTIVALATSAPELVVALDAALGGEPGLAVGNVVGSNICNIALILGIAAMIKPPRLRGELVRRDLLIMILSTLLVPGLLLDGSLSRPEGALLLVSIGAYMFLTVRGARKDPRTASVPFPADGGRPLSLPVSLLLCGASIAVMLLGGVLFVHSAVDIALSLGVPPAVVGLSATALGTSLPELTASVIAARRGHAELAAGNLIGSNISNLLLILGATSVISPLQRAGVSAADLLVMIGVTLVALALMVSKARIERREGAALVVAYFVYLAWLLGETV